MFPLSPERILQIKGGGKQVRGRGSRVGEKGAGGGGGGGGERGN